MKRITVTATVIVGHQQQLLNTTFNKVLILSSTAMKQRLKNDILLLCVLGELNIMHVSSLA